MHLPEIDTFAHLDSPLHAWDPRTKIVSFSILLISIVLLKDLTAVLIALALAIVLVLLSRIPFSFVLIHLRWVLLFVATLFLVLSLTTPGDPAARLWVLSISWQGLELGLLVALRAISAVLLIFPMMGTTRFDRSLKALERLRIPASMVQLVMFTHRYIFLLLDEGRRMSVAARSRGWKRKTNALTLRLTANLVGMLLVRSLERAEHIRDAMLSRGYTGKIETIEDFRVSRGDLIKTLLVTTGAFTLHLGEWIG